MIITIIANNFFVSINEHLQLIFDIFQIDKKLTLKFTLFNAYTF